jgi:hypothetical protein
VLIRRVDQSIEFGSFRHQVEGLLGDATAGRRPRRGQRGPIVGVGKCGARRCREDRTTGASEELSRGDVTRARWSVDESDRHVDTNEFEFFETQFGNHDDAIDGRDDPTCRASVDAGSRLHVTH